MRKRDMQTLQAAEMRFLRSVKGYTRPDKIRNEDIRKELGLFSVNDRIRRYRQDWLEHVERMDEGRVLKQALWYRPKGRRDLGRPHRRWNSQKPKQANGLLLELEKKNVIGSLFDPLYDYAYRYFCFYKFCPSESHFQLRS
jgi:hypothetical protein